MKKIFKIVLSYLLITFNTFVFAIENKDEDILKIGALLPLTGELKSLGEDMLYAINLALHYIDTPKIKIYPKDSASKKEKIIASKIYNLLKKSKRSLIRNIKKLQTLKYKICQLGNIKIDYIKILNINKIIK